MSVEAQKPKPANPWSRFVVPWWQAKRKEWRRPKTGRELAEEKLESEREGGNRWFDSMAWFLDAFQVAILGIFVTVLMTFLAVAYFSHPGLVEWIAGWFAENCRVNGVCDLNANMAAFAVANLILVEFSVSFLLMVFGAAAANGNPDLDDRLDTLDNSDMEIVGQLGDLKDQVEALRHERLPLAPNGEQLHDDHY